MGREIIDQKQCSPKLTSENKKRINNVDPNKGFLLKYLGKHLAKLPLKLPAETLKYTSSATMGQICLLGRRICFSMLHKRHQSLMPHLPIHLIYIHGMSTKGAFVNPERTGCPVGLELEGKSHFFLPSSREQGPFTLWEALGEASCWLSTAPPSYPLHRHLSRGPRQEHPWGCLGKIMKIFSQGKPTPLFVLFA